MEDVAGEDRGDELAHGRALVLLEERLAELSRVEALNHAEEEVDGVPYGSLVLDERRA